MNDAQFYDYVARKRKGEAYTSIRESMRLQGMSEAEIDQAIREIDEELQLSASTSFGWVTPHFLIGGMICVFCLILLIFGIFGVVNLIMFLMGLGIMVAGRRRNEGRIGQGKWSRKN